MCLKSSPRLCTSAEGKFRVGLGSLAMGGCGESAYESVLRSEVDGQRGDLRLSALRGADHRDAQQLYRRERLTDVACDDPQVTVTVARQRQCRSDVRA